MSPPCGNDCIYQQQDINDRPRPGQDVIERGSEQGTTTFSMISYRQSDQRMGQGKIAQLVGLREPWMFGQDRIWGSVNISYDGPENLMGEIRKDGTIVFYYDRGAKSIAVCRDLWRMDYHAVDLAGGMLNYRGKYIDRRPLSASEQKRDYPILKETDS